MPTRGQDSLIVALDVPTIAEALDAVKALDGVVSFFKVGLQLFMTGELPRLLKALHEKEVFVDLKVPGDIGNTVGSVVEWCVSMRVRFLTLSESMPIAAIGAAKAARDQRSSKTPEFLTVPFLSSLDRDDLKLMTGSEDVNEFILRRARAALQAGCDGVVASGREIRLCRQMFPDAIIVSPGIRPLGSKSDDHKRFTTPKEAILLGSDYLVVGRPILHSDSPRDAATAIIEEISQAMAEKDGAISAPSATDLRTANGPRRVAAAAS
ncbi:MAG: orotidine-5'-phosphate decarboxylase [Terracidiphilus sp.]